MAAPQVVAYLVLGRMHSTANGAGITINSLLIQHVVTWSVEIIPGAFLAGLVCRAIAARVRNDRTVSSSSIAHWFPALLLGGAISLIALMLGFLLFVIPGILLWLAWATFTPFVVLEGKGPIAALRRSAQLTRGHRWTIFGTITVLYLGYLILHYALGFGLRALWFAGVPGVRSWYVWAGYGAAAFAAMIYTLAWRVAETVLFFELVRLKSGTPAEGLASVFD